METRSRAEQLIDDLRGGKDVLEIFGDSLERTYLIFGKSMREWRSYFRVAVPEAPDAGQCKQLAAQMAALYQEASFFYAASEAQHDALTMGEAKEYSASFNALVSEYKAKDQRLPANATLEAMASKDIIDVRGAIANAKIVRNFWKRILEGLTETRKLLENCTWNNSLEVKISTYNQGNIPPTPTRGSYGGGD